VVISIANALVDGQIKSVYRILSSDKMPQVISAIQLLTELVKSGGPPVADMFYRLVVSDFNAWPKLLSRKGSMREKEISRAAKTRKVSHNLGARPEAIEFIIVILEAASSTVKASIVTNRLFTSPIVKFLPLDPIKTVCNLVRCLHAQVLLDKNVPRKAKSVIFNTENLLFRVTSLHGQNNGSPVDQAVRDDLICRFLLDACTTYGNGVCYQDRGWYPPPLQGDQEVGFQFYNGSLLRFITQLRPLDVLFHRHVLLATLRKCGDLRGPYLQSISSPVRPDLSFAFTSRAGLVQEIISLPLPEPFTTDANLPDTPPSTKVVLGNILPAVLHEAYFLPTGGHVSRLVRYALSQLLHAVLTKLKELQDATRNGGEVWHDFLEQILVIAYRRLPELSSLLKTYSQSPDTPLLSVSCLKGLLLYGDVFSGIQTLDAKAIGATLQDAWNITTTMDLLQRVLLLKLTEQNDEIIWWNRQGMSSVCRVLTRRRRKDSARSSTR
jgi:hypothetical protein